MPTCLFVSDLHGRADCYRKLLEAIGSSEPDAVFLGGDLLPSAFPGARTSELPPGDFVFDFLAPRFRLLHDTMQDRYPDVYLILGNDDPRSEEAAFLDAGAGGLWTYAHDRSLPFGRYTIYGYSYVPPTPFLMKDWERYDVSRYVDAGCVSPEEGMRSVPISPNEARHATIEGDLRSLAGDDPMEKAIFLFHSPPYRTKLDRAALDGKVIDHVPMDVHIGSIGIRRFIELRQPLVTLHGHVHESARLTGSWRDRIGRTELFSAAHDGAELALVRFDVDSPGAATRELL
ncbi:MAG TPA: metallophosphoesterase [Candidatus Polarisedimenticolia bacterium]|nr:metallophosphoesterase [Candidatus Polarisedimenticolia bacterium]